MRRFLLVLFVGVATFAACGGGDADTDPDAGGSEASVATDRDFSGSGSGDFCDLARQYDEDFEDTSDADSSADIKKEYDELTEAIDNLSDEAPDEIKADVEVVSAAFTRFYDVLQKYDFDATKIPEAEADELDLGSADVEASSNRVESYFEKVCGIDSDDDGDTDGVVDDGGTSGDEQAPDDSTEDTADETTETTAG